VGTDSPVHVESLAEGALWRVRLATPKANVIDTAMSAALEDVFRRAAGEAGLKALAIEGEGSHFSFGASVEEHLPEEVGDMLPGFHGMLRALRDASVPAVAVVRGQCLGGGLELALACQRIVAAPDARLGQPEIVLGVFAPAASVLLPGRVGRARAEDLLLTGRVVEAQEALAMGLVDELAEDPWVAAQAWIETHLLPKSASSLRLALAATRRRNDPLGEALAAVEEFYLFELMATEDASEGLRAFLEKRKPEWRNR
jgi:cyclohexa-1,5-dienecarbonyl-CoA hydratase